MQRWLELVTTPEQTAQHPLNRSTAKQLYSFPKSKRFLELQRRSNCLADFYDVDSPLLRSTRACSMGRGTKYDFMRESAKNATAEYQNVPNFSIERNSAPKHSFGVSRNLAPQSGIFGLKQVGPGPGAYDPKLPASETRCTFRIKLQEPAVFRNPNGPGAYDVLKVFDVNRPMLLSHLRSAPNCRLGQEARSDERKEPRKPVFYDTKYQLNEQGIFFNSKYKNSRCRSFSRAERTTLLARKGVPGPGEYRLPSEFGQYVSSVFARETAAKGSARTPAK